MKYNYHFITAYIWNIFAGFLSELLPTKALARVKEKRSIIDILIRGVTGLQERPLTTGR